MADEGLDEPRALALWCARLPELREIALTEGWSDRLERVAGRVREGRSARAACEQYRLLDSPGRVPGDPVRGTDPFTPAPDPYPARGLGPVPPVGRGSYRCPRQRCPRKGERDDRGHPPMCALFAEPMRPVALG